MSKKLSNPFKAPWPPGTDYRFIVTETLGRLLQLRPGAKMHPKHRYLLERHARLRASNQSATPCVN